MPKTASNLDPVCRVCTGKDYKLLYSAVEGFYINKKFDLHECWSCGIIYTYPYLSEEETKSYYDSQSTAFNGSGSDDLIENYIENREQYWSNLNLQKRLSFIEAHHPTAKKTLDVGCGAGFYVDYLSSRGYKAEGLELSDWGYSAGKRIGANVHQKLISELDPGRKFDVITMYDVLEHTQYPGKDLEKVYSLLNPGGIVIVNLPNIGSLISMATKDQWNKLIPPNHTYHFKPRTLKDLLSKSGFKVLDLKTNNGDPKEFSRELITSGWRLPGKLIKPVEVAYKQKNKPLSGSNKLWSIPVKATQKTGSYAWPIASFIYPILTVTGKGEGIQAVAIKA